MTAIEHVARAISNADLALLATESLTLSELQSHGYIGMAKAAIAVIDKEIAKMFAGYGNTSMAADFAASLVRGLLEEK